MDECSLALLRLLALLLVSHSNKRILCRFQKKAEEIKAISMQSAMDTVEKVRCLEYSRSSAFTCSVDSPIV